MFVKIINRLRPQCRLTVYGSLRNVQTGPQVKEVQIPVAWGHISGKLWGDEGRRPILALHGWQDNAGTWDPLAPLLANGCSVLAIDWPGHGKSSWVPKGTHYNSWDMVHLIYYVKNHYQWDKITLLAHSMGAAAATRFCSLFSNEVDAYVAIDGLVYDNFDLKMVIDRYGEMIHKYYKNLFHSDKEPPSYTEEQILKMWYQSTGKTVSIDSIKILMKRCLLPSKLHPGKFYLSRDPRWKYTLFTVEDKHLVRMLLDKMKCPTLYAKGAESPYATDEYSVSVREFVEKNNDRYEFHMVPGTHHFHLNDPTHVAPLIINFLQKYNLYNSEKEAEFVMKQERYN